MVPWVLIPLAALIGAWLGMYFAGVVVTTHEPEELPEQVGNVMARWRDAQ